MEQIVLEDIHSCKIDGRALSMGEMSPLFDKILERGVSIPGNSSINIDFRKPFVFSEIGVITKQRHHWEVGRNILIELFSSSGKKISGHPRYLFGVHRLNLEVTGLDEEMIALHIHNRDSEPLYIVEIIPTLKEQLRKFKEELLQINEIEEGMI